MFDAQIAEVEVQTETNDQSHVGLLMMTEDGRHELFSRAGQRLMGPTTQKSSIKFAIKNGSNVKVRAAGVTSFIEVASLQQARQIRASFRNEENVVQLPVTHAVTEIIEEQDAIQAEFSVAERFQFMRNYVEMVSHQVMPSAVICGGAGLGKTASVLKAVKAAGLIDLDELPVGSPITRRGFKHVKGTMTPKALFRLLHEMRNGHVIIFDDCDKILKHDDSVNVLKAALDSYETRRITWGSEMRGDDDLPRSFVFEGGVIIISNLQIKQIDDAILSRSQVANMQLTKMETIEYMTTLAENEADFMPDFSMDEKYEVIEFLSNTVKSKPMIKAVNLRHLVLGLKQMRFSQDWQRMTLYKLMAESR